MIRYQEYARRSGAASSTTAPGATIAVYATGTTNLSTIYEDNGVTPKANPFVADSSSGYFMFYAANGRYDVRISGTGISQAYTWADVVLLDAVDPAGSDGRYGSLEIARVYDAKAYGAVGDGVTNDRTALNTLANTTMSSGGTLHFPPGTYLISTSMTFPAGVALDFAKGAKFSIASGQTVTINGAVEAGLWQIFSGSGTVAFAANYSLKEIYPQWWGATGDGATDDYTSIQATLTAAATSGGYGITVFLPTGDYRVGTGLTCAAATTSRSKPVIRGSGNGGTLLRALSAITILTINDWDARDLKFEGPSRVTISGTGILLNKAEGILERLYFDVLEYGIDTPTYALGATVHQTKIQHCYFNGITAYGIRLKHVHNNNRITGCDFVNGLTTGKGISVGYASGIVIRDCSFHVMPQAINFAGTQGPLVEGCYFEGITGSNITTTHTGTGHTGDYPPPDNYYARNVAIENNVMSFSAVTDSFIEATNTKGLLVKNNWSTAQGAGLINAASTVTLITALGNYNDHASTPLFTSTPAIGQISVVGDYGASDAPDVELAPTTIQMSAVGSQIGLAMSNRNAANADEIILDLTANAQAPGVRSAQIAGINVGGGNNMALALRTQNGAPPITRLYLDPSGNIGLAGRTVFGDNAVGVIGVSTAWAAPTTSPADAAQLWVADIEGVAGEAGLHMRGEETDTQIVVGAVIKADTGDPAYAHEGLICINTFDDTLKMYADGAWREIATSWTP